jgi:hypothetical protein
MIYHINLIIYNGVIINNKWTYIKPILNLNINILWFGYIYIYIHYGLIYYWFIIYWYIIDLWYMYIFFDILDTNKLIIY